MKFYGVFAEHNEAYAASVAKEFAGTAMGALLQAHDKEIERKGAEATNYGWVLDSPNGIASKTTKGILETDRRSGAVKHTWSK
ncbi:MAG TPA: hypothetical protein VKB76_10445 [Ktedonobacterales bacterium]|nr:hypothetical protein [Ktedonobacterales bacterium]